MGQRYDLEMQTLYLAEGGDRKRRRLAGVHSGGHDHGEGDAPWAASVSILFDRVNFDPSVTSDERLIVDEFFDSLSLDKVDATANE
jgi:hypothetical protein